MTGKIYENEQENAMFRFEIYKLIDQQNEVKVEGRETILQNGIFVWLIGDELFVCISQIGRGSTWNMAKSK